jgi:hypothetical protein
MKAAAAAFSHFSYFFKQKMKPVARLSLQHFVLCRIDFSIRVTAVGAVPNRFPP